MTLEADQSTPDKDPSRRSFLRGMAVASGAVMLTQHQDVFAMMQNDQASAKDSTVQAVSEHARANTLPPEAFDLPRWIPDRTGAFDLSDPLDNHYAFAKVQANLAGEYSFGTQYGLLFLAPPGVPAYPWLGKVTFTQLFVTPADSDFVPNHSEHDYVMWGTFNQVYVDPRTFKPIEKIYNPGTAMVAIHSTLLIPVTRFLMVSLAQLNSPARNSRGSTTLLRLPKSVTFKTPPNVQLMRVGIIRR